MATSKIKPLRDVWFRFLSGSPGAEDLSWSDAALILHGAGLIELIPNRSEATFSHYRDRELMKNFTDSQVSKLLADGMRKMAL